MIDQKPSSIEEAPSLSDIKSAKDDRLGRVDFTARLGERDAADAPADGSVVSLTSMTRPGRATTTPAAGDDDGARLPFILPPAKVDEALAAEALRVRRAIAAARGGVSDAQAAEPTEPTHEPDPTDQVDEVDEADEADEAEEAEKVDEVAAAEPEAPAAGPVATEAVEAVVAPAPVVETPAASEPTRRSFRRHKPAPEAPAAPAPTGGHGEGLRIQGVASLEEIAAEAAAAEAAAVAARQEAERLAAVERAVSEAAAAAAAADVARLARVDAASDPIHAGLVEDLDDLLDEDFDGFDDLAAAPGPVPPPTSAVPTPAPASGVADQATPDQAVADVAASVIGLMRNTQDAHQRHLESIELEAARRCELLTAQAELDAELIRLHARREAHAIVSAARMRVGTQPPLAPESAQLGEIGETFSRFAEAIETTVALGAASPDQTRKS